jgi:hypothetical protein
VLVRKRFSARDPGQVTGYAVALPGDTARDGGPVWYGGGKLAADLTWPKLRQRWIGDRAESGDWVTAAEREEIWEFAARAADDAALRIRLLAGSDPAAAADATWAAGDTLRAAAAALGSRTLRQAADAYDRAARAPYGRIPRPARAGQNLRRAARLMSSFAFASGDRSLGQVTLILRLATLTEAVAVLRQAQQRAAQAASALRAAEQLHAAGDALLTSTGEQHPVAGRASALADAGFPLPPHPVRISFRAPVGRRPGFAGPRPRRRGR